MQTDDGKSMLTDRSFENTLDVWNWKTERGKILCRLVREFLGLEQQNEETDPKNFYKWERYIDHDAWVTNRQQN